LVSEWAGRRVGPRGRETRRITLWRGFARFAQQEMRRRGRNSRAVAVIGATRMGENLARMIAESPWLGMRLVGFYDDRNGDRQHAIPAELGKIKGGLDDVVLDARRGKIDIVYITLPARAEPRINATAERFTDSTCSVYLVPDFYVSDLLEARWSSVGDIPVVSIFESPFYGVDGWLERAEDIVLGSLILGLVALPMLVIAAAVRLTSKGPVFFRQRRYGLNGQAIDVLKFRTTVGHGERQGRSAGDSRRRAHHTPGAFLRRTSLDELPQFLSVVTGEMSIVGPRPHAVAHNELYRSQIHGYMLRHKVKPGITGWAQVKGLRGETDTLDKMEKRVEHDCTTWPTSATGGSGS
jgi:putative colanic acid biosynthesis UDP-glucose lipid carrier transferase